MNVVLVGFMASGKTSIGKRLAQRLGYAFLDTDHYIENQIGCSISDIFALQGEEYFRNLESKLAERLRQLHNSVIATGGGMIVGKGNLERLRAAGTVVFIKASMEDILQRLERDTRRPKAQQGDQRETLTRMMTERLPIYEQSAIIVETPNKSVNRVCGEIIQRVGEFGKFKDS